MKQHFTNKKITFSLILLLFSLLCVILFAPIQISYTIKTKAQIQPQKEWSLYQSSGGKLSKLQRDFTNNTIQSLDITEFQRGDVVTFRLVPEINYKRYIKKGDTLGFVYSNEEQRKLLALEKEVEVLLAEYSFYTTGQKPEDIEKAKKEKMLALQEWETEQKRFLRFKQLFKEGVISTQEYELLENSLRVKQLALSVAEASLASVSTGEKKEQAIWTQKKIESLQTQLAMMKERIGYLTLTSPIQGKIATQAFDHFALDGERILTLYAEDTLIAIAPIRITEKDFLNVGHSVTIKNREETGTIIFIDNTAIGDWTGSAVYVRMAIAQPHQLLPGEVVDVEIKGRNVSIWEYFKSQISGM